MKKGYLLVGLSLIIFVNQAAWITFSPVSSLVSEELGVTRHMIGLLAILFPAFFLLLTIPSGLLLDRSFHRWLTIGVLFTAAGTVLRLIYPRNYTWLLGCQILLATGQPFLLNSFAPFASRVYPGNKDFAVSVLSLAMYLGIIYSMGTGYFLYTRCGLVSLLVPIAVLAIIGLILYVAGYQELIHTNNETSVTTAPRNILAEIRKVIGYRELWLLGVVLGLGVALFDNMTIWLETVLDSIGLGNIAGIAIAAALLLGLGGVAFVPSAIARRSKRTYYIRTATIIGIIVYGVLALYTGKVLVAVLIPLLGLVMLPAYPIIMEWISTYYPREIHGGSSGFIGFVSRIFTVVLATVAAVFTYSPRAYFMFLAGVTVIAFIVALTLPGEK